MSLEGELTEEIKRWTAKLEDAVSKANAIDDRGRRMLSNIEAYRQDSQHFLERGDMIKSFECLIWAWALLETGKELNHLK